MSADNQSIEAAQTAWLAAMQRAKEAEARALAANEEALRLFTEYATLAQPGFASFLRRCLRHSPVLAKEGDAHAA